MNNNLRKTRREMSSLKHKIITVSIQDEIIYTSSIILFPFNLKTCILINAISLINRMINEESCVFTGNVSEELTVNAEVCGTNECSSTKVTIDQCLSLN